MTDATVHVPPFTGPTSRPNPLRTKDALWLVVPAASGVVLGVLWWLLAPGGLNLVSGNPELANPANPDSWLPRDLMFAALMVLAGCFTGVMLDGKLQGNGAGPRLAFALLGGAAGAAIAWVVGLLAAQLWGTAPDPALGPDFGFTLRSYAALLLWPGATAFVIFALTLFGVLTKKTVK